MTVLVDTREQPTLISRQRYKQFGVPYRRQRLDFGDYSAEFVLPDGTVFSMADKVVIERKMDLDELCQCYAQQRGRFTREFERAEKAEARTYLLVENATWEKAYGGLYHSHLNPSALVASMQAWLARYDCRIILCDSRTTGRMIHDILYREANERLKKLCKIEDG